ncbi:hypothetical protein ABZM97_09760 [Bacillus vallismortis]|uniref:hypothetical protein n=1 Tax=Bacillus vallismortis TaxID=72361 RepID=UPI00346082A0
MYKSFMLVVTKGGDQYEYTEDKDYKKMKFLYEATQKKFSCHEITSSEEINRAIDMHRKDPENNYVVALEFSSNSHSGNRSKLDWAKTSFYPGSIYCDIINYINLQYI